MTDPGALAAALGIGLLVGLERERRKGARGVTGAPGIRTFAITAVLGAILAQLDEPGVVAVGLGFIAAAGLINALYTERTGMTTPAALTATYALGVLTERDLQLAAALAVGLTLLLAERGPLHELARDTLTQRELLDGLFLAACALIVLPLLPNEGVGPGGALNPVTVWRLVVVIMGINALGYVALRALGARRGLPLAGLLGGFVSATATIGEMGAKARAEPRLIRPAVAAALAATIGVKAVMAVVLGVSEPRLLGAMAAALALGGAAAVAAALVAARRGGHDRGGSEQHVPPGRAFDLKTPLVLGLTITAVLALAHALQDAFGAPGAIVAVGLAGFADSQSAAVSAAQLAAAGRIDVSTAALAVLLAISTNTITKAVFAVGFHDRRAVGRVWLGLLAVLAATWTGYAIQALVT